MDNKQEKQIAPKHHRCRTINVIRTHTHTHASKDAVQRKCEVPKVQGLENKWFDNRQELNVNFLKNIYTLH